MWRNFIFLHICHAYKFEISPHDKFFSTYLTCDICDKYQVCKSLILFFNFSIFVAKTTHTWYLSQISQIRYVEKNLSCGEISNLYAWQMWRNLTFLHLLSNLKNFHMTDVEKSEVSPHLACIWCGECLYICTRYAVLSKKGVYCDLHRFVAKSVLSRFTHFCVEKNGTKYCVCGEKMTNIRYDANE